MALNIETFVFNPFQENTYVVWDDTGQCIIIDAGNYSDDDDRRLHEFIVVSGLEPVAAVNTHGHIDHILGTLYVAEAFGIPFALHSNDNFLIDSAAEHASLYGFRFRGIPAVGIDLSRKTEFAFGKTNLRLLHTPGHTPGHVCLFDPESLKLFTGDTLFKESIGRTDLPGGDYTWIMHSILNQIIPLGNDVAIYPGHGPTSTIGHETLYNPFITEVIGGEVNPD